MTSDQGKSCRKGNNTDSILLHAPQLLSILRRQKNLQYHELSPDPIGLKIFIFQLDFQRCVGCSEQAILFKRICQDTYSPHLVAIPIPHYRGVTFCFIVLLATTIVHLPSSSSPIPYLDDARMATIDAVPKNLRN
ncbi:hypothetical protein GUJ93_ZPchr0006g43647 [Zizania palustris]|uniref:Uncharacterized protein n=1 Tax=Zizania palustris TaxID=103762 RepID=A0A8J5W3W6_ZIZPA|nr:hypothetical protein GUJ93_ZPchr0006g43647 [Zizania palustris]